MSNLKILNVGIKEEQFKRLKKLAFFKQVSLAEAVRCILDEALGTVDAATIILKHPDGKEERL